MSVESSFSMRFKDAKQIEAAEKYSECMTEKDQDYSFSTEMEVYGLTVDLYNCFCIDDFRDYLPRWCKYIAECTPDTDFSADGEFTEDGDGFTIFLKIEFKEGVLKVEKSEGYEVLCVDDEDEEEKYEWDLETATTVYRFDGCKLVKEE